MIRNICLALAAIVLAACEPSATSREPLLPAGPHPIREGLWALLGHGCAEPRTPDVATWPSCAMPVWIDRDSASYIALGRLTAGLRWADGDPALIQLAGAEGAAASPPPWLALPDQGSDRDPGYGYFVARGEGGRPYTRGRVWQAACRRPALDDGPEDVCEIRALPELRTLAAETVRGSPGYRAVWVAGR